jgi:hypothetical protein
MPRIAYSCKKCSVTKKKFYKNSKDIDNKIGCECGGELIRQLSSPSQRSKIIVDNGVQAKETELDRDIVDIIEDREESQLKRRGDAILEKLT